MMASDVASSVDRMNYERRRTESDVTLSFMNATKSKKRSVSISNTDISSVSGCTTARESTKETVNSKEQSRRVSVVSNKTPTNPFMRRRSTFKAIATSISGMLQLRKLTVPSVKLPKIIIENTYKMSPDAGDHIATSKIEQLAEQILEDEIGNKKYDSYVAGDMACALSAKINSKVKELNFPRYRIICQVTITQVKDQGIEAASRCLWDAKSDNFTTVAYKNESIAAIAMLYWVYLD